MENAIYLLMVIAVVNLSYHDFKKLEHKISLIITQKSKKILGEEIR